MTREEMEQLYRAHIIPENRAPYHFEVDAEAPMQVQAYNPMCGDKFTLYLHPDDLELLHELNNEHAASATDLSQFRLVVKATVLCLCHQSPLYLYPITLFT